MYRMHIPCAHTPDLYIHNAHQRDPERDKGAVQHAGLEIGHGTAAVQDLKGRLEWLRWLSRLKGRGEMFT